MQDVASSAVVNAVAKSSSAKKAGSTGVWMHAMTGLPYPASAHSASHSGTRTYAVVRRWTTASCAGALARQLFLAVAYFVYSASERATRREGAHAIASCLLEDSGRARCVVVARMVEDWESPYQFFLLAES